SRSSIQSILEVDKRFDEKYYNYLVDDNYLIPAEAAVIANGLAIFKEEFESGNLFKQRKDNHDSFTHEQILQYYLELALTCGRLEIIKYLIDELHVSLSEEKLLHFLFLHSPYEGNKYFENIVEIYNYLEKKKEIGSNKQLLEEIFLKEAKKGHFNPVKAIIELKIIPNINITDPDGHTAFFYCILESKKKRFSFNPEELGAVDVILSVRDKEILELIELVDATILAMEDKNEEKLVKLRRVFTDSIDKIPEALIEDCLSRAIESNDVKMIQLLLPVCNPDLKFLMLGKVNSVEAGMLLIEHFISTGFVIPEARSLEGYAHRLGLNEYTAGAEQANRFLLHAVAGFVNRTDNSKDFKTVLRALQKTVLLNGIANVEVARKILYQTYLEGEPLLLTVGWTQHGVGLSILWDKESNKTYLVFSNRGQGGIASCLNDKGLIKKEEPKAGSVIYEIDGKLDEDFFSHFEIGENNLGLFRYGKKAFEKDIKTCLKDARVLPPFIFAAAQNYATCGYVNTKQSIRGLLCVFAMTRGDSLSEELIDKMSRQYKEFTTHDRNVACSELIEDFQRKIKFDSRYIQKEYQDFIVKLILSHCTSDKPEDIERTQRLFVVLPEEIQEKLAYLIPCHIVARKADKSSTLQNLSLFKHQEEPSSQNDCFLHRPIGVIPDSVDNLLNKYHEMNTLLKFLESQGYTEEDIPKIVLENNSVRIHTKSDRDFKYKVKDLFPKDIQIVNVQGRYEFILKDLTEVSYVLNKLKGQTPANNSDPDFGL
ncbi:TPA: Dot/Icm T4SS effector Lem7, partial [Legionella pneumophila subsp. pneumophila]|nr:Dot/Icm T4SS effector Lem7 [Legionella pneumophila subsp. pneumophila]